LWALFYLRIDFGNHIAGGIETGAVIGIVVAAFRRSQNTAVIQPLDPVNIVKRNVNLRAFLPVKITNLQFIHAGAKRAHAFSVNPKLNHLSAQIGKHQTILVPGGRHQRFNVAFSNTLITTATGEKQ